MAITSVIVLFLFALPADARTVLVTGATGATGTFAYKWLQQQQGVEVRALVRNTSIAKARSILGCSKCDESEGIYPGDVTVPSTLAAAMANVDVILSAVGSNKNPEAVIFQGTLNQIAAYAVAPGLSLKNKHFVKVGAALTTKRFNPIDILFAGGSFFYHGVSDTDISVSGIPYTILQPCALANGPAHKNKLIVGHDDKPLSDGHAISGPSAGQVSRADVGHLAGYAAIHPNETKGLKFDFCADLTKPPTGSEEEGLKAVFKDGMLPWDPRAKEARPSVLV